MGPEPESITKPSLREVTKLTLIFTIIIELITLLFRYGFSLDATTHTQAMGAFTFGIRIHHLYLGILLLIVYPFMKKLNKTLRTYFLAFGLSLVLSDAIHHFAVLWPLEGSPHFDLVYPR